MGTVIVVSIRVALLTVAALTVAAVRVVANRVAIVWESAFRVAAFDIVFATVPDNQFRSRSQSTSTRC